jgi:DNA polymerase II small subunit
LQENLRNIVKKVVEAGYQLSPEAYELLQNLDKRELDSIILNAIEVVKEAPQEIFVIDHFFIKSLIEKKGSKNKVIVKSALAMDFGTDLKKINVKEALPAGEVEGFIDYFKNRFESLDHILRQRMDAKDSINIGRSRMMPLKTNLKVNGIVTEIRSRGTRLFLEVEDKNESITVMASDAQVVKEGLQIQKDQVICIDAYKYREDLLIAKAFIWPDIPIKTPRNASDPVCAVFASDIHIGSVYFNESLFQKFLDWLNRDIGNQRHREWASRVKYVIIAGDLVDGIGIYPKQINELNIVNIKDQYEKAYNFLSEIPEYIEIIIIPGNHDAVRRSLPQPAIPEKYAPSLHKDQRVHLFDNPCVLNISGVEILIDHGKYLDDLLTSTPGYKFHKPTKGMELLLKIRHLAPTYGLTTPIAPEREDRLVIRTVPDIFVMGHVHIHDMGKYKGVPLLALGTFQDQTPFQSRMGISPTPGIVNVYNLQTHQYFPLNLNETD